MKRLQLVFLVVIVLGGMFLWWIDYQKKTADSDDNQQSKNVTNDVTIQEKKMHDALQELKQAKEKKDEKAEHTAVQNLAEAIGGKVGGMLGMSDSTVGSVHFYGRVIDQNGLGVGGARIDVVIGGGGYMAPGTGQNYFMTNEEGYFEVKGKGNGVSILDVKHPDIADLFVKSRGDVKRRGGPDLEATNQYGKKYNWSSYEDKQNPLEIHVWRVEKFEKVKVGYGTAFHPTPDGQVSKNSIRGGIIATCVRDAKVPNVHWRSQIGSWSITFKPNEGGIQESNDLYLNEAPLDGYQPELIISMQQGSPNYQVRIYPAKHFYYYFMKDGKRVYGSLEATFDPFMYDDECRVPIKYKYSLSGSRNLAVRSQ
jgi:hypothetical protein